MKHHPLTVQRMYYKLTLNQCAGLLGISTSKLSKIENGDDFISDRLMKKIKNVFGIEIRAFLKHLALFNAQKQYMDKVPISSAYGTA